MKDILLDRYPATVKIVGYGTTRQVSVNDIELNIARSRDVFKHSVEFNWGYEGSGPAQLALALLLEVTGEPQQALNLYHNFKRTFVSKFPGSFTATIALREWAQAVKEDLPNQNTATDFMVLADALFEHIHIKSVGRF